MRRKKSSGVFEWKLNTRTGIYSSNNVANIWGTDLFGRTRNNSLRFEARKHSLQEQIWEPNSFERFWIYYQSNGSEEALLEMWNTRLCRPWSFEKLILLDQNRCLLSRSDYVPYVVWSYALLQLKLQSNVGTKLTSQSRLLSFILNEYRPYFSRLVQKVSQCQSIGMSYSPISSIYTKRTIKSTYEFKNETKSSFSQFNRIKGKFWLVKRLEY